MRPPGLTVDSNWLLNAWSSRLSGSGPWHCSGAWASPAHKKLSDNRPSSAICTAFAVFGELSGYVARRAPEPGLLGRGVLTVWKVGPYSPGFVPDFLDGHMKPRPSG